jgi:ribosome biogenesis GTPase A
MTQQSSRHAVFPPAIAQYIDIGVYLLDARAPASTIFLDELLVGKELLLLTRAASAAIKTTERWQKYFVAAGYPCLVIDSVTGQGFESVLDYLAQLHQRKLALARQRGMVSATLRVVALGVPNVGKSTFLNTLIGRRRLRTGDRPGITRGYQWVRLLEDVEVLDTPGILRDANALNRRKPVWMLLNLMPYDTHLREQVVELLLSRLTQQNLSRLCKYYKCEPPAAMPEDWHQLAAICAASIGAKLGNDEGLDRSLRRLLRDFQEGRFGRLSLEVAGKAEITSPIFHERLKQHEDE